MGGEIWGVLNLESTEPDAFGPDDLLFGDTIAATIGAALAAQQAVRRARERVHATLAVLSDALEAKDSYTAAHAREVADLADARRPRAGHARATTLRNLSYGALLHDVGKIGVPTEILRKPGPLTDEEFEEIKRHTIVGAADAGADPVLRRCPSAGPRRPRALGRQRLSRRRARATTSPSAHG